MRSQLLRISSQALNLLTLGRRGEMFCARAHRREWKVAKLIDRMFGANHCAAMHARQQKHGRRK